MFELFVWLLSAYFCVWGINRLRMLFILRKKDKTKALRRLLCLSGVPEKYVLALINGGANVNAYNLESKELPSLYSALSHSQPIGIVRVLAESGAHVNGEPGFLPLLAAALSFKRTDVFDFLVSKGADIRLTLDDGSTLLHIAAYCGNPGVVENLAKSYGFDVNHPNKSGTTPLMAACARGNKSVEKALLKLGADPEARDHDGKRAEDYKPRGFFLKRGTE